MTTTMSMEPSWPLGYQATGTLICMYATQDNWWAWRLQVLEIRGLHSADSRTAAPPHR